MAVISPTRHSICYKIVFCGGGMTGKTTILETFKQSQMLHTPGNMLSLATETDRTLFFDFLAADLGVVSGMRTIIHFMTVPGVVFYKSRRQHVLRGADAVLMVADSQRPMFEYNLEIFEELKGMLNGTSNGFSIPFFLAYNKRDLPNIVPLSDLRDALNPQGIYPDCPVCALNGHGVDPLITGLVNSVIPYASGGN